MLSTCEGFEWDEGNSDKNLHLHDVTDSECEQVFFNLPLLVAADVKHSQREPRYYALGRTDDDRWLFIAFTVRNKRLRIISARDMNDRELKKYANRIESDTSFQQ